MSRKKLKFYRNGKEIQINEFSPDETLLDYLRLSEKNTGTKEGCNEGDCGACTIALGRVRDGKLSYEPVNSCIQLLGQIDGADIITVDDLQVDGKLHPVQQAMVENHGSQCGFCTPGFVMSLFAFYHSDLPSDRATINDYLAGNLCRCTGYRPITDAAIESRAKKPNDALSKRMQDTQRLLQKLQHDQDLLVGSTNRFFAAPASLKSLSELVTKHKDAQIVSGATDVGLWVTKKLQKIDKVIYIRRAKELLSIKNTKTNLEIGAGVTYHLAFDVLAKMNSDMGEVLRRLGSRHVRTSGTIGGNIANGSPIGDMPPMLIALGAKLELLRGSKKRVINLEDFFIEYGKQDRRSSELVSKIIVPKLGKTQFLKTWKISKRFDQDISALLFAARFDIEGGKIKSTRIALGGMAGTPKRAMQTEQAMVGLELSNAKQIEHCIEQLEKDFTPLSDMRASAKYRMQVAKNLLRKALLELSMNKTSVTRILKEVSS